MKLSLFWKPTELVGRKLNMFNQRSSEFISYLDKRVTRLEHILGSSTKEAQLKSVRTQLEIDNQPWDNSMLMRQWNICERTAANYRKQGLEYFMRGGRIYYNPEQRQHFVNQFNKRITNE